VLYSLKHGLEALLSPLSLALLLAVVGALCRFTGRARAARALLSLAALLVYAGSMALVGDALLGPLERRYPPLHPDPPPPAVAYVVVLGGGYAPRDGVPVTAALNADSLARIVEGVRLALRLTDARLIVSGGAPAGQSASARGYAEIARALGIPQASLVVLDTALDTRAEARSVAAVVGAAPFILVTSAYHMPRAMLEMQHAGLAPIAAPTGQLVESLNATDPRAWLPTSAGLRKVERALHEYVGLAVLRLTADQLRGA
jgi:uncharacterized SAM-binding protein YcdF (DUF218 family)